MDPLREQSLGNQRRIAARRAPLRTGKPRVAHSAARRAVTLLEVLVSMGVIAIGLLGVASLFPVGMTKVQKAVEHDRAAALGQVAFHEIKTRGLLSPTTWRLTNGNQFPQSAAGFSIAFDPMGSAFQPSAGLKFPFNSSAPNNLQTIRVTLLDASGSAVLSKPVAESLMMAQDDLSIDRPDDQDAPAVQIFKTDNPADDPKDPAYPTGNLIHRQYAGEYSWMFTAVPQVGANGYITGKYNVSVVVFHSRELVDSNNKSLPEVPERMVQTVGGTIIGGIGGVEANLTSTTQEYLERIKPGNWVLLSAEHSSGSPIIKWYRVISLEEEPVDNGGGNFTRYVSLAGSDLDPTKTTNVHISLFDGAIAVYERTMPLEGSSMY